MKRYQYVQNLLYAGAAWGGIKGISLIPFYFQRKGTLVSEIAGNLFCFFVGYHFFTTILSMRTALFI